MYIDKISYEEGGAAFEGYAAYDNTRKEKRPGVLVAHAWAGRDQFAQQQAEILAQLGYVGFAWDVYGGGKCYENIEDRKKAMQTLLDDRALLRRRIHAALEAIKKISVVDHAKIAAIGFCFGGLSVLDLARSGAHVKGVVSLHGALQAAHDIPNQKIQSKILVLHGYSDPMVTPEMVTDFEKEMVSSHVQDWQVHVFSNTYHGFMVPENNNPAGGLAYNKNSATRSWHMMKHFLEECFE